MKTFLVYQKSKKYIKNTTRHIIFDEIDNFRP